MRVALFTSNQPRHIALVERLSAVASEVLVVQEVTTVFPGQVEDFYRNSPVMQDYFTRVIAAEERLFGRPRLLPPKVRCLPVKMGDLNRLDNDTLQPLLAADVFVVFGASYIKPPLVDELIARRAVNIHMGLSPFFRGSGCNFWAVHDGHPELVGATIHRLSTGLDSGDILFHAVPPPVDDPFDLGMRAVLAAQEALSEALVSGEIERIEPVPQDRSAQLRCSRHADFTDEVVAAYLANLPGGPEFIDMITNAPRPSLRLRPSGGAAPRPATAAPGAGQ